MKMGRKLKLYGTAALACAACLALAAPAKAEGEKCTLELKWGSDEIVADITENTKPSIDLYKVADAVPDPDYATYSYGVIAPFDFGAEYGDLSTYDALAKLTNEDYTKMGQTAAQTVQDNDGLAFVTSNDGKFTDLDPGLYLAVAHDGRADYWDVDEEGQIISTLWTGRYVYSYYPQLLFLPSTVEDMTATIVDGQVVPVTTADGDWKFDLKATLKPSRKPRMRSLKITKDLESWEDSSSVSFVFDIVATLEGVEKPVYANTVGMTFSDAEVQSVVLKDVVPVDAVVTIKEVYSGAGYEISEGTPGEYEITVLPAEEEDSPIEFEFKNKYNKDSRNGYGIENHFERVEGADGNLTWDFDNEMKWHDSGEE